ncbi:MAG: PQQ-dependent sugar dehydrogenase [Vallitaleaceae bacterium]|nr:PQQ-dependent sugar dehydrogenase [Vallitaleaceae bacterium]
MKRFNFGIVMVFLVLLVAGCSVSNQKERVLKDANSLDQEVDVEEDIEELEDLELSEEALREVERLEKLEALYEQGFEIANYDLERAFESLDLYRPLHLTSAFSGSNMVYIVERGGLVYQVEKDSGVSDVFLDLSGLVDSSNSETGLLGLAFAPNYPEDLRVFVNYTDSSGTKLAVMEAGLVNGVLTAKEERLITILTFEQPFANHNGGHISFGLDGYLYIASGDGGSGGDPNNYAQGLGNPLGKILRIDVGDSYTFNETKGYSIPKDNPFVDVEGAMEEIYAYGLRNPWKYSFDQIRHVMIAADVGQDAVEEINLIVAGGNYGWSRYEGSELYKDIDIDGAVEMPIYEYRHNLGQSITGGYTYYGDKIPSLYGVYIYGDFMTGRIWGLWINEDGSLVNALIAETDMRISSFGLDGDGEIYVIDYRGGIYRIVEG